MPKISKSCLNCGTHYITSSKKSKFCCDSCRVRHWQVKNNKVPDFIKKHEQKNIIGGPLQPRFFKKDTNQGIGNESGSNAIAIATIQKLQNDRNYYLTVLEQTQGNMFPFFTVGGALVFEKILRNQLGKTSWLGMLAGGYLGYKIDKEIYIDRQQKAEETTLQLTQKIREIDKQIRTLQDSELKRMFQLPKPQEKNKGIYNSTDIAAMNIPVYDLSPPYKEFIGNPTQNFSMIIYGLPKSGKSNFAVQLASYFSRNIGDVLYVASEEGISKPLQDKLTFNLAENKHLFVSTSRKKDEIKQEIKNPSYNFKFVFIDSINITDIDVQDLETLRQENKDKAFISVLQATKKGDFKGSQEYAHNADIIVEVDNGTAKQIGRFNPPSELRIFR